jgi:hypothetical protein
MNKDALWTLFEKTGNIDAYMLYRNSGAVNAAGSRGAVLNANKDRRADHSRSECR